MDYFGECLWMLIEEGNTMALSLRGTHFEKTYAETKQKQNLGIGALSTKTHVVDVINVCKMNLKKKRKPY
jgi:hypothetical protein